MVDKDIAKSIAEKEVLRRILTIEQAKKDYKKWIMDGMSSGGFKKETIDFWEEVYRQVDEVVLPAH